ncbi:MAG: DinB family protein [Chloroflexota bacterium]
MSQVDLEALSQTVRQILHEGHDAMRQIIAGLDADALGWRPGRDTNSIAVLVAHSLEAERFLVATAADVEVERDREAQFRIEVAGPDVLLALIDQREAEIDALLGRVTAATLVAGISRPGRTHPGAWWLLHALEHSREHVGQAALTRQLYEQRS